MPMKEWFRELQPMQLYVVLSLTVVLFATSLAASHFTHAIALLIVSYQMLCNIISLIGFLATIKYGKKHTDESKDSLENSDAAAEELTSATNCQDKTKAVDSRTRRSQENKLKNTFGWARIDVISMLICCVFEASLCFSILVESLQTLIHIDHLDEMHHPIPVLCIGAAGLLLNGICFLLIGGYTFHQGSFLYVTEAGDVVLNRVVVSESVRNGERRLSRTRNTSPHPQYKQRQGLREMSRDVFCCICVIIDALLVYFTDKTVAKFIDPAIAMISAVVMFIQSYPYMKESCLILLQTIPDTINIDSLRTELMKHFPDIVNIHDLHIWQLTATKVISTVHIIFQNPKVYNKIIDDVKEFFLENGITQVTIQPEFFTKTASIESLNIEKLPPPMCLMACQSEVCKENHCCPNTEETKELNSKFKGSKEIIPTDATLDLKSVKVLETEFTQNQKNDDKTIEQTKVTTKTPEEKS